MSLPSSTRNARIYVAIPCYRDPECLPTVRSLLEEADRPELIRVGICLQFIPGVDEPLFQGLSTISQVRLVCYDARTVPGLGWARSQAHSQRQDEEYVLQIDSHMRFHRGWDRELLEMLAQCPAEKPALSTYPAAYEPGEALICKTAHIYDAHFSENGMSYFKGKAFVGAEPAPTAFLAGGFVFARADLFKEVPYDPQLGFQGEELGYSLRAYTHGWDFFAPHRCFIHHYYQRREAVRPWDDNLDNCTQELVSMLRLHYLLGSSLPMPAAVTAGLDGEYGLGVCRSRADYERLTGLNLADLQMGPRDPEAAQASLSPRDAQALELIELLAGEHETGASNESERASTSSMPSAGAIGPVEPIALQAMPVHNPKLIPISNLQMQ